MKNSIKKVLAMAMAIVMCLAIPLSASAATTSDAVIDKILFSCFYFVSFLPFSHNVTSM